jgi:hypothetical protein
MLCLKLEDQVHLFKGREKRGIERRRVWKGREIWGEKREMHK